MTNLSTPVKEAGFVYRIKSTPLLRLGILTLGDLVTHIPFRYEDYSKSAKISELPIGELATIKATVLDIKNEYTRRKFVLQKAQVKDETGEVECLWFNQSYITRVIHPGDEVGLVGKLEPSGRKHVFQVKDYEVLSGSKGIHTSGLVPVYRETYGISSKWLRNRIFDILDKNKDELVDIIPENVIKDLSFPTLKDALLSVHFPTDLETAQIARRRISFDELLISHLSALERREEWKQRKNGIPMKVDKFKKEIDAFIASFPFTLTKAQLKAVEDLQEDLQKDTPMNRLLEGDVGSGKTIVAAVGIYIAHLNGYQSLLMAPTEILAQQHYASISSLFANYNIEIALFTSSKKTHLNNYFNIAVGTHALLQAKVKTEKLGFVVIDEQQRFGVEQRAILREKGTNPHFLTMTATPIPRTVLLALYKDLDVSVLDEMPKGRKEIKTWLVPPQKREAAYMWVRKQIEESSFENQAFIVCPFIEESESITTVKAAKTEFERLQKEEFKGISLGLLHGKLKAKEKTEILQKFKDKEFQVLVATPVVEVGIDITDATIMVIEAADRFGLAQLHQLRGRVGRGEKESYCLLFTESTSATTIKRLKYMEEAHSGFELAEFDLKLRGGGDVFGIVQHGIVGLKTADFSDFELVDLAKKEAEKLFPRLSAYKELRARVKSTIIPKITPD